MAKTVILKYWINLTDADLVAQLQAQIDGGGAVAGPYTGPMLALPDGTLGFYRAPNGAAIEFAQMAGYVSFPIYNVEDTPTPPIVGGSLTSHHFWENVRYDRNVATFVQSDGWWIFGSSTRYYWSGHPRYMPAAAAAVAGGGGVEPVDLADIPARHILVSGVQGEIGGDGSWRTNVTTCSAATLVLARSAARLGKGFGQALYYDTAAQQTYGINHSLLTPRSRWERFYFLAPRAPDAQTEIWRGRNASVNGTGFGIAVLPTMQIALLNYSSAAAFTLTGVFDTLEVGRWYKFDILFDVNAPGNLITCQCLKNGATVCTGTRTADGVEAVRYITETNIGQTNVLATNAIFCFDSYISADPPKTRDLAVATWSIATPYVTGDFVRHSGNTYRALQNSTGQTPGTSPYAYWRKLADSIDFQHGSHIALATPTAFTVNHGAWTGDVRILMQQGGSQTLDQLQSTSANALCEVSTNLVRDVESLPGFMGWVCAQVNAHTSRGGAPSGTMGYRVGAGANVDTAFTQNGSTDWRSQLFNVGGTTPKAAGETLALRHTKANDATLARCAMLNAFVEVIGRFGPEDDPVSAPAEPTPQDDPYPNGLHNCQYPISPWHLQRDVLGPVIIRGATYVGTGISGGVTLAFPLPVVFIMIRNVTANVAEPVVLWPTAMESHPGHDQGGDFGTRITRQEQDHSYVQLDPTSDQQLSFNLHIAGDDSPVNTLGQTYQYIAFMDPAARFTRAGAFHAKDTLAPFVHALTDAEFLAEILFAWQENLGNLSTDTLNLIGPGTTAGTVQLLTGATTIASAITVAEGQLTIGAAFTGTQFHQYAYLGFRRADGNDNADQGRVMFLGSYTGDGTASRTINIAPATGLRPMWLLIQPVANSTSWWRDPSHTGTNAAPFSSGVPTGLGITAGGIDSFAVGSSLNTNAVVYNYFGFWGSSTAGNGGWSINTEIVAAEADTPFFDDWTEPVIVEPPTEPEPPGTVLIDEPDLDEADVLLTDVMNVGGLLGGQVCEVYTRKLVNIALSRIGITKQIANLASDATELAATARRHVKEDINAVLRDHPWAFATRYQDLVLALGSTTDPFNNDWIFAYTAPNAMMLARRIAKVQYGRAFDPEPIPFRHYMSVTLGPLILCNAEGSTTLPLVLEYTVRHDCPAFFGDAIFRDALAWRFAKSLASGLSRDAGKADYCEQMYQLVLNRAATVVEKEAQQEKHGDADWIAGRN